MLTKDVNSEVTKMNLKKNILRILKQCWPESQVGDNKPHTTKYLNESEVPGGAYIKKKEKKEKEKTPKVNPQIWRTTDHVQWCSTEFLQQAGPLL